MYKKIILLIAVLTLFNINISSAQKVIPPYKMMLHNMSHRTKEDFFERNITYDRWENKQHLVTVFKPSQNKDYYKYKDEFMYYNELMESNVKDDIRKAKDYFSDKILNIPQNNFMNYPYYYWCETILYDCSTKLNERWLPENEKIHYWGNNRTDYHKFINAFIEYSIDVYNGRYIPSGTKESTIKECKKIHESIHEYTQTYWEYGGIVSVTSFGLPDFAVELCDANSVKLKKLLNKKCLTQQEYEEAMFYYTLLKVHCLNEANRYNEAKNELKKIEYYDKETKYDIENLNLTYPRIMYYLAKGITEYNSGTMYKDKEDELVLLYNYILRVKEECGPENPFNPDYCYMNQNILIVVSDYIEWLNQYGIQGYKDSSNRIKLKLINEGYEIM